jgi:hypothetical protein
MIESYPTDDLSSNKCCVSFLSNRNEILRSLDGGRQYWMFMSLTCSLKVILLATSEENSTTFGLRYGSYDTIWRDNQEKEHEKITHCLSFHNGSWLETVIPARAKQLAMCL